MKWLQNNVFNNVEWLIPNEIIKNINSSGHTGSILKLQNRQLFSLLNTQRLQRMMDAEVTQEDLYSTLDMFARRSRRMQNSYCTCMYPSHGKRMYSSSGTCMNYSYSTLHTL